MVVKHNTKAAFHALFGYHNFITTSPLFDPALTPSSLYSYIVVNVFAQRPPYCSTPAIACATQAYDDLGQLAQAHSPGLQAHFSSAPPQLHLVFSVPGTFSSSAASADTFGLASSGFLLQLEQAHSPGLHEHLPATLPQLQAVRPSLPSTG